MQTKIDNPTDEPIELATVSAATKGGATGRDDQEGGLKNPMGLTED